MKNIDKIYKASKLIEKIKAIDAEIIQIEKICLLLSEGQKCEASFSVLKKQVWVKQSILDEDGSLSPSCDNSIPDPFDHLAMIYRFSCGGFEKDKKQQEKENLKVTLSDSDALSVFAILIHRKNQERQILINKIENIKI